MNHATIDRNEQKKNFFLRVMYLTVARENGDDPKAIEVQGGKDWFLCPEFQLVFDSSVQILSIF